MYSVILLCVILQLGTSLLSARSNDKVQSASTRTLECQAPFQAFENGCYFISNRGDGLVTGDEAFVRCIKKDAHLVVLETLEEAMVIKSKIKELWTEAVHVDIRLKPTESGT